MLGATVLCGGEVVILVVEASALAAEATADAAWQTSTHSRGVAVHAAAHQLMPLAASPAGLVSRTRAPQSSLVPMTGEWCWVRTDVCLLATTFPTAHQTRSLRSPTASFCCALAAQQTRRLSETMVRSLCRACKHMHAPTGFETCHPHSFKVGTNALPLITSHSELLCTAAL